MIALICLAVLLWVIAGIATSFVGFYLIKSKNEDAFRATGYTSRPVKQENIFFFMLACILIWPVVLAVVGINSGGRLIFEIAELKAKKDRIERYTD